MVEVAKDSAVTVGASMVVGLLAVAGKGSDTLVDEVRVVADQGS